MPIYSVYHTTKLSQEQQAALAKHITSLHVSTFNALPNFVNVRFHDTTNTPMYVGGKLRTGNNHIVAEVRTSAERTRETWNQVCSSLISGWNEVVHPEIIEDKIRAVFVMGDMIAGWEAGFELPAAGQDQAWVKQHLGDWKKMAEEGDTDAAEILEQAKAKFSGA